MKKTSIETEYPVAYKVFFAVLAGPFYLAIAAALLPLSLVCAYCDMRIWNWFVAPYFHLAPMGLWLAYAFNLWLGSHSYREPSYKDDERKVLWFQSYYLLLICHVLMLVIGAGMHHWAVR